MLHRPIITESRTLSDCLPSLAICANAAQSCCQVLDLQSRQGAPSLTGLHASCFAGVCFVELTAAQIIIFNAAVMLLLNLWACRHLGIQLSNIDSVTCLKNVHNCIRILHRHEDRYVTNYMSLDFLSLS
jgi:hypothetical protein